MDKSLTALMAAILCSVSALAADTTGRHLFILSGQSNMVGLNPALSFVPAVEQAFGKENVVVVKNAKSGAPIRGWYTNYQYPDKLVFQSGARNGYLYTALMNDVTAATEGKAFETVTFVWMQGERDAKESLSEVYAESFKGVLAQLKADLKIEQINFVIGRISDFDMTDQKYPHWTKIRDIQVKLAEEDERGAWVDTDDLNGGPAGAPGGGLHYDKAGYEVLGQRFAEKAIELVRK